MPEEGRKCEKLIPLEEALRKILQFTVIAHNAKTANRSVPDFQGTVGYHHQFILIIIFKTNTRMFVRSREM